MLGFFFPKPYFSRFKIVFFGGGGGSIFFFFTFFPFAKNEKFSHFLVLFLTFFFSSKNRIFHDVKK